MGRLFRVPLVLIPLAAHAFVASAQTRPRADVVLPPPGLRHVSPPSVGTQRLLSDARTSDLLRNGFPARVHYKLERWEAKRGFDGLRATSEWDAVVRYDPLSESYRVARVRGNSVTLVGDFSTLARADSALGEPVAMPIPLPPRGQRTYYALRVDVEMVSVTDLDEVERWLRGELKPAVRGERNPGTALERGAQTLLVRLLGGERRRYLAKTEAFRP